MYNIAFTGISVMQGKTTYQNGGCYLQCGAHWQVMHYYAIFSVCPCCQSSYCHR